jgi:protein tyrosine phosphatase
MVWQEKSRAIVMLNRVIEKNAIKCHQYFPEEKESTGKELQLDAFVITLTSERITPHFVVRELQVRRRRVAENNGHDSGDGGSNSSISYDEVSMTILVQNFVDQQPV